MQKRKEQKRGARLQQHEAPGVRGVVELHQRAVDEGDQQAGAACKRGKHLVQSVVGSKRHRLRGGRGEGGAGRGGRAQEAGGQVHLRQQGQRVQLQPESEANWSRQLQAGMRLSVAVMQAGRQAGGRHDGLLAGRPGTSTWLLFMMSTHCKQGSLAAGQDDDPRVLQQAGVNDSPGALLPCTLHMPGAQGAGAWIAGRRRRRFAVVQCSSAAMQRQQRWRQ